MNNYKVLGRIFHLKKTIKMVLDCFNKYFLYINKNLHIIEYTYR